MLNDQEQLSEILAKPRGDWTTSEATFVDYMYALTSNNGSQILPYQTLPSGRFLHNPAQKTLKSADKMASDLISNAAQRGSQWQEGISNPSRDPIKAALDSKEKYKNNVMAALQSGKWERNIAKVSHADIVKTVTALGSGVYTQGISARADKIKAAFAELQPKLQAVSNAIQALPNGTDADREKRMLENLKLMRKIGSG